jgi:hypothetical protein
MTEAGLADGRRDAVDVLALLGIDVRQGYIHWGQHECCPGPAEGIGEKCLVLEISDPYLTALCSKELRCGLGLLKPLRVGS